MSGVEKLLPQNLEAETGVLGSCLIDPEIPAKLSWLKPEDFYREAHRQIWQCMRALARQGKPADLIVLSDELEARGWLEEVGGVSYVSSLANQVPTSRHAEHYANIVARRHALHDADAARCAGSSRSCWTTR